MISVKKKAFSDIDEYIDAQPNDIKKGLEKIRQAVKKAAPDGEEIISYQMPAFKFHGILIWFAAFKNHYGLYPTAKGIEAFKNELKDYELSKGTIRFPFNKPLPLKLIAEIVKYRVTENLKNQELKKLSKAKK